MQIGSANPGSAAIYEETNQFVEKWHKRLIFALMKGTLLFITLPYLVWSYYLYFTTDLGKDTFIEPIPVWYDVLSAHNFIIDINICSFPKDAI